MKTYLYQINHNHFETGLCDFEMKALFNGYHNEKIFISHKKFNPSSSPFIRLRLEILYQGHDFSEILSQLEDNHFSSEDFFIKCVSLHEDDFNFKERKNLCKLTGHSIKGFPSFSNPKVTFAITKFDHIWYFGLLEENKPDWRSHKSKPRPYSSSLGLNVAKVLLNVATLGDQNKTVIDPCCGVGTVLIEACYAGYNIIGWEINEKIAEDARVNINHFGYNALVISGDLKDIKEDYDASIVDLPYGKFCKASKEDRLNIIRQAKRISERLVLVSSDDLAKDLESMNLKIIDHCTLNKRKNKLFTRHIWLCEKRVE